MDIDSCQLSHKSLTDPVPIFGTLHDDSKANTMCTYILHQDLHDVITNSYNYTYRQVIT